MVELHLPWLELMVAAPLLGAALSWRLKTLDDARKLAIAASGLALVLSVGAWVDFGTLQGTEAHDCWDLAAASLGRPLLVIDTLNAPLLPLAALLHALVIFSTLRTKMRRFPFARNLVAEAVLLALLGCREPWPVIGMLAVQTVLPWIELRSRQRSTRAFSLHMGLSVGLFVGGWWMLDGAGMETEPSVWAIGMLLAAVLIRSGLFPLHCWMTDLFENATLGTSLLFVTPMAGVYATVRLVLPIAPDWAMQGLAIWSLVTAVYAAGMALVQREARRFFCYFFLSHSSLVLTGLQVGTPLGLTGSLCSWLAVGLSLGGFGLTLRALESRTGRLSLADYHGLYEHMPTLAAFFLITGLASIGFPGTIGFIATELLIDGTVGVYPIEGLFVVFTAALNSIAVLVAYFRLFTGARHVATIPLNARWPERIAVLALTVLILGGGLWPQSGVASRYHAATQILARRQAKAKNLGTRTAVRPAPQPLTPTRTK